MVGESSTNPGLASILCDPTNYDWIDVDIEPGQSRPRQPSPVINPALRNVGETIDDPIPIVEDPTPVVSFQPNASSTARHSRSGSKTTDKDLVDFIYGETAVQTLLRLSNQFTPIVEDGADTLVYIGPPPKTRGQHDHEYEIVQRAFHRPHLLKSETLRRLGPSKFNELLGPKSKRTQRKLQKLGIHKLLVEPEKIKYFVDLTPDIHDDEGMVLLLELSAPPGARSWHKDAKRFSVQPSHVCGRDALDTPPLPKYQSQGQGGPDFEDQDAVKPTKRSKEKKAARDDADTSADEEDDSQDNSAEQKKADPYDQAEEDDYSQLRHHTGLVRLLQAIVGQDPKLNSAPKAWTFCMLAKFFDCAKNEIVSGWIIDWLVQSGNINFIQVNPSIAYRFGMAMESVWLVRTSFCIMVGLKAFENVKSIADTEGNPQSNAMYKVPTSSLITDGLDDDDINRVDHAALALVQRVKDQLYRLLTGGGEWKNCLNPGSQVSKLYQLSLPDPEMQEVLDLVKTNLEYYVRRFLCAPFVEFDDTKGKQGNLFKPPMNITSYHIIPAVLRPLTLQFWEAIRRQEFQDPPFSVRINYSDQWNRTLESLKDEGALAPENAWIPFVPRHQLSGSVDLLNSLRFGPEKGDWPASPKKKVKLSPPPKKGKGRQSGPPTGSHIAPKWSVASTDYFGPAQPATFLGEYKPHNLSLPGDRIVSLPHREKAPAPIPVEPTLDENNNAWKDDEWENVLDDLETQPITDPVVTILPGHRLPIRGKPATAEMSTAEASGVFTQSGSGSAFPPSRYATVESDDDEEDLISFQPSADQNTTFYPVGDINEPLHKQTRSGSQSGIIYGNPLSSNLKNILKKTEGEARASSSSSRNVLRVTNPDDDEAQFNATRVNRSPISVSEDDRPFFTDILLSDVASNLSTLVTPLLLPGFMADNCCAYDIPLNELGTLTCLSDAEYKYLPLWAGGNDDGSGGVFDDGEEIPEAPEVEFGGFRGGAMGIIPGVGSSVGSSVLGGEEFSDVGTEVGVSTVGRASRIATDGAETVMSLDE